MENKNNNMDAGNVSEDRGVRQQPSNNQTNRDVMPPGSNSWGAIFTCPKCGARFAKTSLHCPVCGAKLFDK